MSGRCITSSSRGAARPGRGAETGIPGREHLKGLGQRAGSLLPAFASLSPCSGWAWGLRKGGSGRRLWPHFAGEGREILTKKPSGLREVVWGQTGTERRNLGAPAPVPGSHPGAHRLLLDLGSQGLGHRRQIHPWRTRQRAALRVLGEPGGGGTCSLPAPPGSGARGRRFPPNCCLALPGRKDAAIFLLPAANARG